MWHLQSAAALMPPMTRYCGLDATAIFHASPKALPGAFCNLASWQAQPALFSSGCPSFYPPMLPVADAPQVCAQKDQACKAK